MQNTCSICRSTHSRIRDSNHISNTALQQFLWYRQHPPLRHSRAAEWTSVLQDQYRVLIHLQISVVDSRCQNVIVTENNCGTSVLQQSRSSCGRFDDSAIRCEITEQHGRAT